MGEGTPLHSHVLYLALGTNLGNKHENLLDALDMIGRCVGQVCRVSSFHSTEPWGFCSPNTFLNAACMVFTSLDPMECLARTQQIERQMGRMAKSVAGNYEDRIIDIDLLLYDDLSLSSPQLTLPHPLMMQRDFVIKPLAEIMPAEQFVSLKARVETTAECQNNIIHKT